MVGPGRLRRRKFLKGVCYGSREGRAPIFKEVIRAFEFARPEEIVRMEVIPYPVKDLECRFPLY